MKPLVSIFCVLLLARSSTCATQCYYPNGEESTDFPCDPDADDSVCCGGGLGNMCLTNKLCMGGNGNTVRGSCTDENWASPECAMFCLNANTGGTDLISCSNVTGSDTSYCCDHNAGCCDSGVGRFNVLPSQPDIWATWDRAATQFVVVGTLFDGDATSAIPEATSTSGPVLSTVVASAPISTTAPGPTATTSSGDSPLPTDSASDPPGSSSASTGLSTGAMAGIGAGAGIGALLVAAVIYLLWKMRRNAKREMQRSKSEGGGHPVLPSYNGSEYEGATTNAWDPAYYAPSKPQELHGHEYQGDGVRAELPAQSVFR